MGFRDVRSGLPRQTQEHAFVSRPHRVFAFYLLILFLRFCFLFFFWIYLHVSNELKQQRCNVENNDHIICALACLYWRDVSSSKLNEDFIINWLAARRSFASEVVHLETYSVFVSEARLSRRDLPPLYVCCWTWMNILWGHHASHWIKMYFFF